MALQRPRSGQLPAAPVATDPQPGTTLAPPISRRGVILAGSLLAGCSTLDGSGNRAPTSLERANIDLVTRFCVGWGSRDIGQLMPYLADNLTYQMFEGRPDIVGLPAFREEVEPFLASLARVEWEVVRSSAIGQVVINERVDHFIARPGGRSMHFDIVGLFVVEAGKITLWRDYRLAGTKPRMNVEPPA